MCSITSMLLIAILLCCQKVVYSDDSLTIASVGFKPAEEIGKERHKRRCCLSQSADGGKLEKQMDDSEPIPILYDTIVNPVVGFYEQRVAHSLRKRDTKSALSYSDVGLLGNRFRSTPSFQLIGPSLIAAIFKVFESLSANHSSIKTDGKKNKVKSWKNPKFLNLFPFNKYSDPLGRSKEMVSLLKEEKEQNTKTTDKPTTKNEEKKFSNSSPQVSNAVKHVPRIRQKEQTLLSADQNSPSTSNMDWHEQQQMGYHSQKPIQYYSTPRFPGIPGYPGNINSGVEDINFANYQVPSVHIQRLNQHPQTMQFNKMFYHPSGMIGVPVSSNKYLFGHMQRGVRRQPAAPSYSEVDHNNFYEPQMGTVEQQMHVRSFPGLQPGGSYHISGNYEHQPTFNTPNHMATDNGNIYPDMLDPSHVGNVFPRYQNLAVHEQSLQGGEYSPAIPEGTYPFYGNTQINKFNCLNQVQQGYRCEQPPGQDINAANFVPSNYPNFKYTTPTLSTSSTDFPRGLQHRKFRPVKIVNPKDVVNKQQSKINNQMIQPKKRPNLVGKQNGSNFSDISVNERPVGNFKLENTSGKLTYFQQSKPQQYSLAANDVSYEQVYNDVAYYPNTYMPGYAEEPSEFQNQSDQKHFQTFPLVNPSISGLPNITTQGIVKGYIPQQNGYVSNQQPMMQMMMPHTSTFSASTPSFPDAKFHNKVAGQFAHPLKQNTFPSTSIPAKQLPFQMNGNLHQNIPSNSFHEPINGYLPGSMNDDFITQSNFPNNLLHESDGQYSQVYQNIFPNSYPGYTSEDVYSHNQFTSQGDYMNPENPGQHEMPINMPISYEQGVPNEDMYNKPSGPIYSNQPTETRTFQGFYPSRMTGQTSNLRGINQPFPTYSHISLPKQNFPSINIPNNLVPGNHPYYSGSDYPYPSNDFMNSPYQWVPYSNNPELTNLDNPTIGIPQFSDPTSQVYPGAEFTNNQMDLVNSDHSHSSNVPIAFPGSFSGEQNAHNTMASFNLQSYGRPKPKMYSSYKSPYTYGNPYNNPGSINIVDYLAPETNVPPYMQHNNFPNSVLRYPPEITESNSVPTISPNENPELTSSGNMHFIPGQGYDPNFSENSAYNWQSQFTDPSYYPNAEPTFYPHFSTDQRYGASLYTPMGSISESTCTLCPNTPAFS